MLHSNPNSVPNVPKMLHSNPNIDYVKFGEILSSCSQDIEQKQKSDINHRALTVVSNLQKMTANNPSPDLVNINAYTKFGQILLIPSRYLAQTKF